MCFSSSKIRQMLVVCRNTFHADAVEKAIEFMLEGRTRVTVIDAAGRRYSSPEFPALLDERRNKPHAMRTIDAAA